MLVLAQSWIDISKDAKIGKDQKHDRFFIRILQRFHKGMNRGEHLSKHQVYSKWGKMNKEIMLFNDLYTNMKRQWKSGENDDVILRKTLKVYEKENLKAFKFLEVWNFVKDNKKWQNEKTLDEHIDSGSKRSRTTESDHTTSDTRVQFDLNKDEVVPVSPPSQSMERDKAKKQRQMQSVGLR
ncbi:glutathione S-transferase T3-like [Lactuca sativa]|uniref:glutathione S-transferase T3-like n=1 Tax=Lactuca sativa TaxID=4236 RepID=UPI000CD9E9C7|nr:glutathione S-transferase T3-like [Lactuca sativa]